MQHPKFLKPGDTLGIIAPSRKIGEDLLRPCLEYFKTWELNLRLSKNIYAEEGQFAGNDALRRNDLQEMLDDPEVKAVICARGGYGTIRILEGLNLSDFIKHPKWIIGYSDITVLHSYFQVKTGCPTIHGIMPVNYNQETGATTSWNYLQSMLFGEIPVYETPAHEYNRVGVVNGKLVGGNLSVLYSMAGTTLDMDLSGCILFLEDLDEYLYHVDRMMMNLKLSGKLEKIKGLIIGGMSDMRDNAIPFGQDALEIIRFHTSDYDYPVLYDFPAGHISNNYPMIFGVETCLEVKPEGGRVSFRI